MIRGKCRIERGSTLIMVLWMLTVLSGVAAFLIYRSEMEWATMVNFERRLEARRLAVEVLQERLELLQADDNDYDSPSDPWFDEDGISQLERNGYQIIVRIEDEGSKPNVNLLTEDTLRILTEENFSGDPLLDWVDPDQEPRADGAEDDYYLDQEPAYRARNGFISSLSELRALKDGDLFYEALAPYCTVYGKFNPNTMGREQFENLLQSYGVDRSTAERIANEFVNYRANQRFHTMEQFMDLRAFTFQIRDFVKPLFRFDGFCNPNFIDEMGLKVVLKGAGYDPGLADDLIRRRDEAPFDSVEEITAYLKSKNASIEATNYFTVISSIFRIQIWLTKGTRCYYLETIQSRERGENFGEEWQLQTLAWNFLMNEDVPEQPAVAKDEDEEEANE